MGLVVALPPTMFSLGRLLVDFAVPAVRTRPVQGLTRITRKASATEGEEFRKARERIRRIQLGLGPDEPLPEDDADIPEEAPEKPATPQEVAEAKSRLDLAEAGPADAPVEVKLGEGSESADTAVEKAPEEDKAPVFVDPFSVESAKDVPELQPEVQQKKDGPNFFQALVTDFGLVTLPTPSEVLQTFGIVLGLVALYTGFVAVVDYGSQKVLGQVFEDFYTAAKPEAPAL